MAGTALGYHDDPWHDGRWPGVAVTFVLTIIAIVAVILIVSALENKSIVATVWDIMSGNATAGK